MDTQQEEETHHSNNDDSDTIDVFCYERIPQYILDLLNDEKKPKEQVNVADTQEPTTTQ